MKLLVQLFILALTLSVEFLLTVSAPALWHRFATGDIASGVVLAMCVFLVVFALRTQLAIVLGGIAMVCRAFGSPLAGHLATAAARVCPKVLRTALAASLATTIGVSGVNAAWASTTEPDTPYPVSTTHGPTHGPTPVPTHSPQVPTPSPAASPSYSPTPGWPDSGTSPGWPQSPTKSPAPESPAAEPPTAGPSTSRTTTPTSPAPESSTPAQPPAHHAAGPDTKAAKPQRSTQRPTQHTVPKRVTVRRGDTLWAIAKRHLRAQHKATSDSAVWNHVLEIHRKNRHVIGADPDLILPGQRLELP